MKNNIVRLKIAAVSIAAFLILLSGCSSVHNENHAAKAHVQVLALQKPSTSETLFNDLVTSIAARFDDPMFAHAHWGVLIESLSTGEVWYERNADRLFIPASNEKIPTTAAALTTLGPDFRFTTILAHTGTITTPTLDGDLVVWSNGDPTMYEKFQEDSRDVFRAWGKQLRAGGLTRITGDVIGNDNAFDDNHFGYGWTFDNYGNWYAAEVGPLNLNENYVDFEITPPGNVGEPVSITANLPSKYYTVVNNITVVDNGRNRVRIERPYGTNDVIFNGEVVAGGDAFSRSPSISNPTLWYATVLAETFEEEGIEIDGKARDIDDLAREIPQIDELPRVSVYYSPPLIDILTALMKRSQNLYAEIMPRVMSWQETGKGSFADGRKIVQGVLDEFGVEPGTYAYMDGSGMSRYNFISPRLIVKTYKGMLEGPYADEWRRAQTIAGVDGTLRRRMKGTSAEGNVRGKTGTVSNVRAVSGLCTTADGEPIVFSFLVNAHLRSSRDTETITDDVLVMITDFDRGE